MNLTHATAGIAMPKTAMRVSVTQVLLWNLADYDNGSLTKPQGSGNAEGAELEANTTLQVCYHIQNPTTGDMCASSCPPSHNCCSALRSHRID